MKRLQYTWFNSILVLLIVGFLGCSKPFPITAKRKLGLISKDKLEFTNDSKLGLFEVDVTLVLHYPDRKEKYQYSWSKWQSGESKTVELPNGLKNLQKYHLSGFAFWALPVDSKSTKNQGPVSFSNDWGAN